MNWHGQITVVLPLDAAFSCMLETELGPPPSLGVRGSQNLRQEGWASSRGPGGGGVSWLPRLGEHTPHLEEVVRWGWRSQCPLRAWG